MALEKQKQFETDREGEREEAVQKQHAYLTSLRQKIKILSDEMAADFTSELNAEDQVCAHRSVSVRVRECACWFVYNTYFYSISM